MASYDELVAQWGESTVAKAFWLQRHIHRHGIEGIHFMGAARKFVEEDGDEIVANAIELRL